MKYKTLGDRMKGAYENRYRLYLPERLPVIIRLDGRAFHTFCRGLKKPFDQIFIRTMQKTTLKLCENISGCKLGYVQSDEISLLLMQSKLESQPWFDNNLQKIVSVSASMATLYFNQAWEEECSNYLEKMFDDNCTWDEEDEKYVETLNAKSNTATFDSRVFVLPEDEVCNYYIWRQQDASKNSILSLAQSMYSPAKMHGFKTNELQDKMFTEYGINWNDLSTVEKRGTCVIPMVVEIGEGVFRNKMTLDTNIPIFTQKRNYIEDIVFRREETL